jgi:uncharacterized RDD family membrane protein YckC
MTPHIVSQQLKSARMTREKDLATFARQVGISAHHLCAIEEGRFADLPAGIYGRSAVKSYATACGLDPAEMLGTVEPWLKGIDDPIFGLARLKGIRVPAPSAVADIPVIGIISMVDADAGPANWRPLGAALIDALIVTALLLVVVLAALSALLVPVSALDHSSPAFGVMGVLLALGYYLCFGGVGGATVGERVMHVSRAPRQRTLTLHAVATRALQSASEDVRCLCSLGARVGRWLALSPRPAYGDDARTSS